MSNVPTPTPPITNPEERNAWVGGFSPQAEIWNGRLAMLGFVVAIAIEFFSGQGVLHYWGLL
ncbi:MAG: high light inducible protein [Microcoleus sp. SIO2G3]|nr:high light inducible protein [Microcoleus sp. SIO2G3]